MSEFPSLPLFTDAFLADTGHLDAQETGAYVLLIMVAWRASDCELSDDDARLAKWARVDLRTWKRIKPTVMEFWKLDQGKWSQKRLKKEREIVSKRVEAARENGKHGGRPKPLKSKDPNNPVGSSGLTQQEAPKPKPSSTDPRGGDARARDGFKISDEAQTFATELASLCGQDLQFLTPEWMGAQPSLRAQMWLNAGWSVPLMREAATAAIRKKRDGAPHSVLYFDKIFARAHAPQLPLPVVQVVSATPEISNVVAPSFDPRRSRRNNQDTIVAGMAAALREQPGSRLGGHADGVAHDFNDSSGPGTIDGTALRDTGTDR